MYLLFKTKGNPDPKNKPQIYFTCHPDDFDIHFSKICEDIFQTHDCTIFYANNMIEKTDEQYLDSDLGQMNLVVIPVTRRLLSQPNRAIDSDFRYAKDNGIPVLPIMMETKLGGLYSRDDKFGDLQYLDSCSLDSTAIRYEDKLKIYLDAILIDKKTMCRIREAFDSYVFLSYRKKDRNYATKLMKIIHSYPEYRHIAIWYDEFLTPGESFNINIEKMMKRSTLFMLLVTPSLLEYVDGKPNYVMEHEYPKAKAWGMTILPVEMKQTNHAELKKKYNKIPNCVKSSENEAFYRLLKKSLSSNHTPSDIYSSEHNFLIGLAYLNGIDVEVNREVGLELIQTAANSGNIEAIETCYKLCKIGGSGINYKDAIYWGEKMVQYHRVNSGTHNIATARALCELALAYRELQNDRYTGLCYGERRNYSQKSVPLLLEAYKIQHVILGKYHKDTLITLRELAIAYLCIGEHEKAHQLLSIVYSHHAKIYGEDSLTTIITLRWFATSLICLNCRKENPRPLLERSYSLQIKKYGKNNPFVLDTLETIIACYDYFEDEEAITLSKELYRMRCEVLGEDHQDSLQTCREIISIYLDTEKPAEAAEWLDKYQNICFAHLKEDTPQMLHTLEFLSDAYCKSGNIAKGIQMHEKLYQSRIRLFGKEDIETLQCLDELGRLYSEINDYQTAMELGEQALAWHYRMFGEQAFETSIMQSSINNSYLYLEEQHVYLLLDQTYVKKIFNTRREILGADHPKTIEIQKLLY